MLLQPRYGGPPVLRIDGPADDQRGLLIRQRRRMEATLANLTEEQWNAPSRCDEWSAQDVLAHLVGTNRFWHGSIAAGLAGSPTKFLVAFDPAATPRRMVDTMRSLTPLATFEQFVDTNRALFDTVESLDDTGWSTMAEAPPGHVPIRLVANHALWDAWVHERDILLPLGITPAEEPDEVVSCLRYVAALGPCLGASPKSDRSGAVVIDSTEPYAHLVIEVGATVTVHCGAAPAGATHLRGRAVELVEMLSIRAPLGQTVDEESRWLLGGLAEVFDDDGRP
jgi:uncharacterized protein (TIGR03083 family)